MADVIERRRLINSKSQYEPQAESLVPWDEEDYGKCNVKLSITNCYWEVRDSTCL